MKPWRGRREARLKSEYGSSVLRSVGCTEKRGWGVTQAFAKTEPALRFE